MEVLHSSPTESLCRARCVWAEGLSKNQLENRILGVVTRVSENRPRSTASIQSERQNAGTSWFLPALMVHRNSPQILKTTKRTALSGGPPGDVMNEIVPGLYLGSWEAAYAADDLRLAGVTHVLTAMSLGIVKLNSARMACFTTLQLPIFDVFSFNIAQYLPQCVEFIYGALADGGKVLVHCYAGVSRSATAVAAYLMTKRGMSPDEALTHMRDRRPCVSPNPGFLRQLHAFHLAGCVYVEDDIIDISTQRVVSSIGIAQANTLRCKKCRRVLATRSSLAEHHHRADELDNSQTAETRVSEQTSSVASSSAADNVMETALAVDVPQASKSPVTSDASSSFTLPKSSTSASPPLSSERTSTSIPPVLKPLIRPQCSGYFVEPDEVPWVLNQAHKGEVEGKLICPNEMCGAKLGNWSWTGMRCGCSEWVIPGFCLARGKVDPTR